MSKRKAPSDDKIKELYLDKEMSSGMIAEKYRCARGTICKHLRRLGITRPQSGPNSRNKKRSGEVLKSGYPVIHMPNHHRASHIGYVYKHVLVMEDKKGKRIKRERPIHHIDFDRKNYDPENLYLCRDNKHHKELHCSMEHLARELFHKGIIEFKDGEYVLAE